MRIYKISKLIKSQKSDRENYPGYAADGLVENSRLTYKNNRKSSACFCPLPILSDSKGVLSMRLNHLNLTVPDVSQTREFFETYFGLRCVLEKGRNTLVVLV